MKVYIIGRIGGGYRSQHIVKVLMDSQTPFSLSTQRYEYEFQSKTLVSIIGLLLFVCSLPMILFKIARSSHVVLLPMNNSLSSLLELGLARVLKKIIIVDYYVGAHDAEVNDRQAVHPSSWKAKFLLWKDRARMRWAKRVIFLSEAESSYYQSEIGLNLPPEKIVIIPLCVDQRSELVGQLLDSSAAHTVKRFSVCWWGTYIPLHGVEQVIRAFSKLPQDQYELFLLGDSDKKSKPYQQLISDLKLNCVHIDNSKTFLRGDLAAFLTSHCDLALGNFGSSNKANTVLVNKVVDALSLGLPCLTLKTAGAAEFLTDQEDIFFCTSDPDEIARSIIKLSGRKEELRAMRNSAVRSYLKHFSPDVFRVKFLDVLASSCR